jgi:hypothetical protein
LSNDELILATLKDIKREMGSQSVILNELDVAVRGSRDGNTPGVRAEISATKTEVDRAHDRLDTLETKEPTETTSRSRIAEYGTPAASGGGVAALLYVVLEFFRGGS